MDYKDIKVYVIDSSFNFDFRQAERGGDFEAIMKEAYRQGTVYELTHFQDKINDEELNLENSFIYITDTEKHTY